MIKNTLISLVLGTTAFGQTPTPADTTTSVPIATQWLYDAVAPGAKGTIDSVVRILCKKTNAVGSGFVLDSGYVVTNHHVVQGCAAVDLEVVNSLSISMQMADLWFDENRDLAAIKPKTGQPGTFKIEPARKVTVGTQLSAWGYPFAHPGPAPLLTVGYLSGFYDSRTEATKMPVKRLVVNGAFNPGNSGGALISPEGTVVGVVVAKRIIPLTPGIQSALSAMATNKSGVVYSGTQDGKAAQFSESQVIALILDYYRQASQVFIGEAIAASELTAFLDEKKIPWSPPAKPPEKPKNKAAAK